MNIAGTITSKERRQGKKRKGESIVQSWEISVKRQETSSGTFGLGQK